MTAQTTPRLKRIARIPLIILMGLLCLIMLLAGVLSSYHVLATRHEKAANPAPGAMVDVDGKMMHVYTQGQGDTTYVVLSGGGIGAPVLEYRPLWSRLSQHGRVAVVEYMGYGWSDDTDAPRTSERIVEEIRAALRGAHVEPPYVLVAHSIGGIYAMKYAQLHEDELEAIVALDTTLPQSIVQARAHGQSIGQSRPPFGAISLLRKTGILRALLRINPLLVSGAPEGVYAEDEARKIAMVTGWNYAGRALINEFEAVERNMTDLADAALPRALPVLMIQASPPDEPSEAHAWSLSERKRLTENLDHAKVVELPAGHSGIYWTLSDDIVKQTLSLLEQAP